MNVLASDIGGTLAAYFLSQGEEGEYADQRSKKLFYIKAGVASLQALHSLYVVCKEIKEAEEFYKKYQQAQNATKP